MRRSIPTLAILISLAAPAAADWDLLAAIEVEEVQVEDRWEARKTFPDGLAAAAEGFEITGHVVPVVPDAELRLFLLVPDPDECPFCGDAGYGPSLEVEMRDALDAAEGEQVTLRGDLEFVEDPETWQAVRLTDAVRAAPSGP